MASTDARPIPIKNTAFRAVFPILDADGDLVTGAAGLDSEVSKDQGTFADCTNEATEIATSSGMYYLDLTSTEMNADCVAVIVKTSTSGAKTTVLVLYPVEAGDIDVDVTAWNGTAVASPATAGIPEVNVKNINNVSAASVTTINANQGTTQPVNFTGTGASALAKSDMVDVAGAAVSASTAQIGANVVNFGGAAGTFASGRPEVNVSHWKGTAAAAVDTAGYPKVTVKSGSGTGELDVTSGVVKANLAQILGTALTETAGQIAAAFKQFFNVASPTGTMKQITLVDTVTTLTNAPSDSSGVTTLLSRLSATRAGYLDNLSAGAVALEASVQSVLTKMLKYFQLALRKDSAIGTDNATEKTAINANGGSGAGSFDQTTDSQEALRDRGDAAWTTATGFSTLDAAGVRSAVGLASANLDTQLDALPTASEIRAEVDANSTQLAAIVADTNEVQTELADGGRTDLLIDAIKAKTDGLPADPADASDIAASFTTVNTKLDAIDDYIDTEVAAIKAKTDLIPASPAAVGDIPTAVENADALLKRDWTSVTGEAARSVLNALRALRNRVAISGGTVTVYQEDDSTSAWTAAATTDASADPITEVDPS